jgi:UDP-N-acetylmuramate: L-alanyl-gamma-D-glutamyl-meso-diaminopimelate ligase
MPLRESFYFLGVGGSAMGQVALLLHAQGYSVSGADKAIYPPISNRLQDAQLPYHEGYNIEHLLEKNPSYVVVGNAMSRGNPVVEWLLETRHFPVLSLPQLIAQYLLKNKNPLVITGTHGKTTTTAATSWLLEQTGAQPGFLIGGVTCDLPSSAQWGKPQGPFVIEGDEYDSAFFDKRSKFIHYAPWCVAIGNIEFDHADIFRDVEDIQRSFSHLLRLVPQNGFILSNGDDPNAEALFPVQWATHYRVGLGDHCDLRIQNYTESQLGLQMDLYWQGAFWATVESPLIGLFNARNLAMASLVAALSQNPKDPIQLSLAPLKHFQGVKRRQEIRYQSESCVLIDDFAHHPTAIEGTLKSLRTRFPGHLLLAVFEPRTNTTVRATFQDTLPQSLSHADEVWITPIQRATANGLNPNALCADLLQNGIPAQPFHNYPELLEALKGHMASKPTVIAVLSNGSCGNIMEEWLSWKQTEALVPA